MDRLPEICFLDETSEITGDTYRADAVFGGIYQTQSDSDPRALDPDIYLRLGLMIGSGTGRFLGASREGTSSC